MAQSLRTSSCFVGEYFNWLKLNGVHPGKGGRGLLYPNFMVLRMKKEYAVLNDDSGWHHHEGDREKPSVAQVHTSSARESEACISGVCSSLPHPTTQQYPSLQSLQPGLSISQVRCEPQ